VTQSKKQQMIEELVGEFRASCNLDGTFDGMAADRLRLNATDLRCINIVEHGGGLGAGELAVEAGLTTGAVTGVIDRLERAGYARRVPDPGDRRRVRIEVTPAFYTDADEIWGPVRADWETTLSHGFTAEQLDQALAFLRAVNAISRRHVERMRTVTDHS
jgi:DNA-binding MarR family transcriptional regulator